jgi:hypothetical protein
MKSRLNLQTYFIATFLALCTLKLFFALHKPGFDDLIAATKGVVSGRPHWIAYQNRILGPYLVLAITKLGLSFRYALILFDSVLLIAQSWLLVYLFGQFKLQNSTRLLFLVIFLFSFLALHNYWFYPWDSIDLIVFTFFSYGVAKEFPVKYFVGLFIVAIFNRESALFIALYILLEGINVNTTAMKVNIIPKKLIVGITLLICGVLITHFLRISLFISQAEGMPPDNPAENQLNFSQNIYDLLIGNFTNSNFIVSVGIFSLLCILVSNMKSYNTAQMKSAVMVLILTVNIFIFGLINETRMFLILLPFIFFIYIDQCRNKRTNHLNVD